MYLMTVHSRLSQYVLRTSLSARLHSSICLCSSSVSVFICGLFIVSPRPSSEGPFFFFCGRDENGQAYNFYRISQLGCAALSEFEDMARQQAANKRQNATQNKLAVIGILVPLVTFLLGLVVEHFTGLLNAAISFFHK